MDVVGAGGEEGDVAQKRVRGLNQTVEAALSEAQLFHKHLGLLGLHVHDVLFKLGGYRQHCGALLLGQRGDRQKLGVVAVVGHAVLVEVGRVDDGLGGEQAAVLEDVLVLVGEGEGARGLALRQVLEQLFAHVGLVLILFVAALEVLFCLLQTALDDLDIGQNQFEIQALGVGSGVGRLGEEDGVVKAANHVDQRVGLADVLQNRVAAARALAHAGHVHKVDGSGRILLGLVILRQPVKPLVGDLGLADVGLVGRSVAAGLRLGACECVIQRRLAHRGKTHDT